MERSVSQPKHGSSLTMVGVLVVLFAGFYLRNQVLSLVALAAGLLMTLANPRIGLALYIASSTVPDFFEFFLKGISFSRIVAIAYLLAMIPRLWRKSLRWAVSLIVFTLVLLCVNAMSFFGSLAPDGSLEALAVMTLNFAVMLMTVLLSQDSRELAVDISKAITVTLLFFCFYLLGIYRTSGFSAFAFGRISLSADINVNGFALALTQCLMISSYALLNLITEKGQFILTGLASLGAACILVLTGSRSGLLGLAIGLVALVLTTSARDAQSKQRAKRFAFWCLVGGALAFLVAILVEPNMVRYRFSISNVVQTHGTRRTMIWELLLTEVIPHHLLVGTGIGGASVVNSLSFAPGFLQLPAHNIAIDILTQLGLMGLLSYGLFFLATLKRGIKGLAKSPIVSMGLIVFIASLGIGLGETIYMNKLFWVAIAFCWQPVTATYAERKRANDG